MVLALVGDSTMIKLAGINIFKHLNDNLQDNRDSVKLQIQNRAFKCPVLIPTALAENEDSQNGDFHDCQAVKQGVGQELERFLGSVFDGQVNRVAENDGTADGNRKNQENEHDRRAQVAGRGQA